MSTIISFVSEIENAVACGDPTRRAQTLRKMTDLFVAQSGSLQELHVSVFDEVLLRLARDLEFRARIELSDRLADIDNAPRQVVRDLALDANIAVAAPVLTRSKRLTEDDLVEVAERRSQDHLLAITKRPAIPERVSDVIVGRGNERVLQSVARNEGARFTPRGLSQLLESARSDENLQMLLKRRADLPADQMAKLMDIAREKVAGVLKVELGDQAGMIDAAVEDVATSLVKQSANRALLDDFDEAMRRVAALDEARKLNEDTVVSWAKQGDVQHVIAALAHYASVSPEMVARAYYAPAYDPLLFIVRSIRFGWATFKLLLVQKAGRQPPIEVMRGAFDSFQQLSVATAQRVVRFTAAREAAAKPDAA
jgi:uncharacterized protein (DUF2336 family)